MFFSEKKLTLPSAEEALPGREEQIPVAAEHVVLGQAMAPPFDDALEKIIFGMGCFWGAERRFWEIEGVYSTAVGYIAGLTPNPLYEEVCSGMTGHNEAVLVVYNPRLVKLDFLLKKFWESHDPTQGMRQGNDRGTQYRSGIYYFSEEQKEHALQMRTEFQTALVEAGLGCITTEIMEAPEFYYAEDYHQQYLAKNPSGYCGLSGTGIELPVNVDFVPRDLPRHPE
ncbi:MAG: peptide-methionine (S)-S-oxide reductase [Gammaproteobacteria bacterium]|nr:MAG: peptide-methionine (S)-S-oxide reductase [Gammaproteobacteria bacterium]RLA22989.1 MAG: peptide-methionine (S)-S-oxide reductase [Gammaproteobacteria bacterium]